MLSLWEESQFWRLFINAIGAISIILGIWLIYKLIKSFVVGKNQKRALNKEYVTVKQIPYIFSGLVQIAFEVFIPQIIEINILDENEKVKLPVFNKEFGAGLHVENIDVSDLKNEKLNLEIKTDKQRILRSIEIKN